MIKDRPGGFFRNFAQANKVPVSSLKVLCVALHQQSNDKSKQSENSGKDFDSENLDEPNRKLASSWSLRMWVTCSAGSAASARAALLPLMPTQTPQIRLHMPTVSPAQKRAYPVK